MQGIAMSYHALRNQIVPEITKINEHVEKLEESIAGTDDCVVDIYNLEEKLEDRLDRLEEELMAVKAENVELKNHLNSAIKELNAITELLNNKYGDLIETTYEFIPDETQDGNPDGETTYSSNNI